MSSSFYSRRTRYGSTSYKDGGYVSDGGYNSHKLDSRLNKSRSVEDLTSTRQFSSNNNGVYSSRSLADVYGTSTSRGNRFSVDKGPSRKFYPAHSHGRDAEGGEAGISRSYGSRESINEEIRKSLLSNGISSSKRFDRRADNQLRGDFTLHGGDLASHKNSQESASKVKYRISGEIVRENASDENFRGYYSDTGLINKLGIDDTGYDSEKAVRAKANQRSLQVGRVPDERLGNWRSKSLDRNNIESSPDVGRSRTGRDSYRLGYRRPEYQSEGATGAPRSGQRRAVIEPSDFPTSTTRPRSRSSSPMRRPQSGLSAKIGSPMRRSRRMDNGRPNDADTEAPSTFPVCSRWPNCTVCSIDIPSSQIVSIQQVY